LRKRNALANQARFLQEESQMPRSQLLSSLAFASLVAIGWPFEANAQTIVPGYAINRFDPSQRGSRWFTLESLEYGKELLPNLGVIGDFGHNQMRMSDVRGGRRNLIKDQIALHLGASMTFAERVRIGLQLPVYVLTAGKSVAHFDGIYRGPSNGGVGDLRIAADVLVVGAPKDAFRLALGARLWAPTGKQENYAGDGKAAFQAHVDVAGDIASFAYAARLGYTYRGLKQTFGPTNIGDEIPFGVSAGIKLFDDALLIGPELQGAIAISDSTTPIAKKHWIPLYGILGAHYTMGDVQLGAGLGPGLSEAAGTAAFRGLLSLEWVPKPKAAPVEPGPNDSDGDGITDDTDACKDQAGVANDDPAKNGCPAPVEQDKDGDGVLDADDACPEQAGAKNDDTKKNGCPSDQDNDGIVDAKDACQTVAGAASEDPNKNGCPPDTDGDGIVDNEDACPKDAGPKNTDPKKNGCPSVIVSDGQIKIYDQVKFQTASAQILKESDAILDAVAKTLAGHPEIKKVRVEGHTDNVGKAENNKNLSKRRAAAVVTALVKRKIDRTRLESQGIGQDRPIDSNGTDAGRQNNRRVEFHIL
jgi:OmpA-OmpF porin, OOP family